MARIIQQNTGKPSIKNVTKKLLALDGGLDYITFKDILNFILLYQEQSPHIAGVVALAKL